MPTQLQSHYFSTIRKGQLEVQGHNMPKYQRQSHTIMEKLIDMALI